MYGYRNFPAESVDRYYLDGVRGPVAGRASSTSNMPGMNSLENLFADPRITRLADPRRSTPRPLASTQDGGGIIEALTDPGSMDADKTDQHEHQHQAGNHLDAENPEAFGPVEDALRAANFTSYGPGTFTPNSFADELFASLQDIVNNPSTGDRDFRVDSINSMLTGTEGDGSQRFSNYPNGYGGDPIDPSRSGEFARIRSALDAYNQPFIDRLPLPPNYDPRQDPRTSASYIDPWSSPSGTTVVRARRPSPNP